MNKINFKIATPERVVYKEDVDAVTLPTRQGEITVLPNHIPLISVLTPGMIRVKNDGKETLMAVSGGFIEVLTTKVVVLADTAERSDEIDVARAEAAIKKAQELREQRSVDIREFATLTAKIEKELARARVGRKTSQRVEQMGVGVDKFRKK